MTAGVTTKNEIIQNKKLAEELHKPIIRKFGERKVHSSFANDIWVADLAYMQYLSKFKKSIYFFVVCY